MGTKGLLKEEIRRQRWKDSTLRRIQLSAAGIEDGGKGNEIKNVGSV